MTIKAILFDKDGTLFHYTETWGAWARATLLHLTEGDENLARKMGWDVGYRWESNDFVAGSPLVVGSNEEIFGAWGAALPHMSLEEIDAVCRHYIEHLPDAPVCDLNLVLGELRTAGYILGVATNDYERGAAKQLEDQSIAHHFAFVAGFDSGYGAKPEPGQILGFAETTGIDPTNIAMVGDSNHDLHAGANAKVGLKVGVLTGPAVARDIEDAADIVLPDISHLNRHLQELA